MHTLLALITLMGCADATVEIEALSGQAPLGYAEIHGVAAGEFNVDYWESGNLHFLSDHRMPLIESRLEGVYRNIYAPSAVRLEDAWHVYYGAWDGVHTGNDRIYRLETEGFLDFKNRRTIIEHGDFIHVCNVNVSPREDGGFDMMCTTYPDSNGMNKPAFFSSPGDETWNGTTAPYPARQKDIVEIAGYPDYAGADINGMNVLLREGDQIRLYHGDFNNRGHVFRATSTDGKHFTSEGSVLEAPQYVNDVKVFENGGEKTYLMALHQNGDTLWYSLSESGTAFDAPKVLGKNESAADRYIVAIGWVRDGRRLLGYLYGAGPVSTLNRNRLFARWLQKRLVFKAEQGDRIEASHALGPDRQLLPVPDEQPLKGKFEVYAEDGVTQLGVSDPVELRSGGVLRLNLR
ncbi:MAG: hypothetical protein ACLFTT_03930 [Candidatus Hydrogenedentota bacterium]